VNKKFLEDSGLFCEKNVILYERDGFREELQFLETEVIVNSQWGWIIGLPGCGKSITVYFYLLMKVSTSQWEITWIHLSRNDNPMFVQFHGNQDKCSGILENGDQLTTLLGNSTKRHILVLDGLTDSPKDNGIQLKCRAWHIKDLTNRRFVIVSSMAARGKYNPEDDEVQKVKVHTVYSWKLEEYEKAIENNKFLESVNGFLDSLDPMISTTAKERIVSKYYFSGGSARFTFHFKTQRVLELLQDSMKAVTDITAYLVGTKGILADDAVNRLFKIYEGALGPSIVSEYAASELALKMGPRSIECLYESLKGEINPALEGWMLEMWFFAAINYEDVQLFDSNINVQETWPQSKVINFDPSNMLKETFINKTKSIWLKPLRWNQGGYDAVCVNIDKQLLTFVQITRGSSHSLKLPYFRSFLHNITNIQGFNFQVTKLEIYFLIPKSNLGKFSLSYSDVTGKGCLSLLGWTWGLEQNYVTVRGIKGFDK